MCCVQNGLPAFKYYTVFVYNIFYGKETGTKKDKKDNLFLTKYCQIGTQYLKSKNDNFPII